MPWLNVGTGIVASSEEIAMAQVEGYGSIPGANSVSIPALSHVSGMPVTGGSPLEIYAATILSQVPSGYAGIQTPHPAKAVIDDAVTPMEAKFTAEFTRAITGITAHQANELANRLLEKYEDDIVNAPRGKKYQECYDLRTQRPSEEYIRLYDEVVAEMIRMGICFN